MFKFSGRLTYTGGPRDSERVWAELLIGFFPPRITISIHDEWYESAHRLVNSRFNFQPRDSFTDLLARDTWKTEWVDIPNGSLHLVMPAITGVSRQLDVMVCASWWPAFCVVEFRQDSDYCQIATRPRASFQSRWLRFDGKHTSDSPPQQPINSHVGRNHDDRSARDDSPSRRTDPASSSANPPPESPADEPVRPIVIDFDNADISLKHWIEKGFKLSFPI